MSKIIVEDHTKEPNENPFEETYVVQYVNSIMPIIVNDGITLGLSPKELVYAMFLLAENLKAYAIVTDHGTEEEYKVVYSWAEKLGKEWGEKVKSSGIIEKVKGMIEALKKKEGPNE